jgi:hypothetical protein
MEELNQIMKQEPINDNPFLYSPEDDISIFFAQTRETLYNSELYNNFVNNAVKVFRSSKTYKNYKSYLMEMGLNRCQHFSNIIADEMAEVELHHNMLTLHDIALIICEHVLNTIGQITTFQLRQLIKEEHKQNHVQIVMLSKTPHQMYTNTDQMFYHPDNTFGDWESFVFRYRYGITFDIANKLIAYIGLIQSEKNSYDNNALKLRDEILSFAYQNAEI